jgi:hypothetical protein
MSWKKRYAIGALISLFAFAALYSNDRPSRDVPYGAVLIMAAAWPVTVTLVLGLTVRELARENG